MFLLRAAALLHGFPLFVGGLVILLMVGLGFLVQRCLLRCAAPLAVKLLPSVLSGLLVVVLRGCAGGLVYLSPAFYNTLVRGGVLMVWGVCGESFLLGCLACWLAALYRFLKKSRKPSF